MNLGMHLRIIRKERGYTQKQMADFLNLSRSTYTHYENNSRQPDLAIVGRVADLLNVSIDYLTGASKQRSRTGQLIGYLESQARANPQMRLADLNLDDLDKKSAD